MVKVCFEHETDSISLSVKGHAGQSKEGKDIVCSAVSILTYTVAQYLKYVNEVKGLKEEPQIILDSGNALIIAKPNNEYEPEVLNAYFVAEVGFSLLAENYPQFISLKTFGKGEKPLI